VAAGDLAAPCYNGRVPRPISNEVIRLVRSLFEERSLLDRARRHDHRLAPLERIAKSREFRVVPELLPLLAADEAVGPHVGRVIAVLVRGVTSVQLSWLDEQVRHSSSARYESNAWHAIAPADISRLARTRELDAAGIGLLASHANGFVRAAALELLAQHTSGREMPFIALRANDWVDPIAARARELLISRLRPENRHAVVSALPSLVRVLAQRRRGHGSIGRALTTVLLSDGGEDALARGEQFDASSRRALYELLTAGDKASRGRLLNVALKGSDAVIRARALRSVAADPEFVDRAAILERPALARMQI
jgi:hypothetical protein